MIPFSLRQHPPSTPAVREAKGVENWKKQENEGGRKQPPKTPHVNKKGQYLSQLGSFQCGRQTQPQTWSADAAALRLPLHSSWTL